MAADGAAPRGPNAAATFSAVAIGLAFTLPFLQPLHRYPLTSFYSEWLALALGLAAVLPLAAHHAWRALEVPATAFFLGAFGLLLAVHQGLGLVPYGGQTLVAVLYLAWAMLLMVLAATLRREIGLGALVATLAWFLLAGGVLGAVVGLLQHLGMADALAPLVVRKVGVVVHGNLAQPNHFAAYTAIGLASLTYLNASGRLRLAAACAPAALLVFVLGLSGSRSAWAYLALLVLLALLHVWRAGRGAWRPAHWAGALVAVFLVAQWLAPLTVPVAAVPASSVAVESAGVATSAQRLLEIPQLRGYRSELMAESWWMFRQAPVAGVGWGQFPWHDYSYRALTGSSVWGWPFNHAHNIGLHLLAETGLLGAGLVLGAGLFWLWGLRRTPPDIERWWLLAVLGVLGAHSMVELPMWYAYFLGIAAVALGAGSERNFPLVPGRGAATVALALIVAGAIPLATTLHAYRDFERLFARDGTAPEGNERAAILSRAHREAILKPHAELALSFGLEMSRERLREKIEFNDRVMRYAPIDAVLVRRAMLLALAGEREAAHRQLRQVGRAYPSAVMGAYISIEEQKREHPAEMTHLLELAASILAELRDARKGP